MIHSSSSSSATSMRGIGAPNLGGRPAQSRDQPKFRGDGLPVAHGAEG
jgi:hypothetical protein